MFCKNASGKCLHVQQRCTPPVKVPARESAIHSPETTPAHLCKMELQRIIRAQTNIQAHFEEIRKRIPLVRQKQRVIT